MPGFEFNEQNSFQPIYDTRKKASSSGIIGFLIRKGWVKDIAQANIVLIGVSAIAFALTAFFLYRVIFGT
jgi:hypothetical protein